MSDYGGDDERSMAADNTSGFNCRTVAGGDHWSAHAYGAAVDLNPLENPDLHGGSARTLLTARRRRTWTGLRVRPCHRGRSEPLSGVAPLAPTGAIGS